MENLNNHERRKKLEYFWKNFSPVDYNVFDNTLVYSIMEFKRSLMQPVNFYSATFRNFFRNKYNPIAYTYHGRQMAAALTLTERVTRFYIKHNFGIKQVILENREKIKVTEKRILRKDFCDLLHFRKYGVSGQEKMLIVAPLSGHYATLLRGTVEGLLPHFDVYITDWANAADVPLYKGGFDLDDYVDYIIEFIRTINGKCHVLAVCQPSVPVMAAVSILAQEKDAQTPKSMTLMGGPIDTRVKPTQVNKLAEEKSFKWFEENAVSIVPFNYHGFLRKVYPGFLQLSGFMTMNLDKHVSAYNDLFNHLIDGDGESAEAHKKFYNEYLAVMDIPAEFYLQTIKLVFQQHALPKGTWVSRGRKVDATKITTTAVLAIEGERDDISGVGQTKAALDICTNLADSKKQYHLQKDTGHYGIFSGRKYREQVVPVIRKFIEKNK
jgi:poly(3-hydroxybutyrate) depolymerase